MAGGTWAATATFVIVLLRVFPVGPAGAEPAPMVGALSWKSCTQFALPWAGAPLQGLRGGGPASPRKPAGKGRVAAGGDAMQQKHKKNKMPKRSREKAAARKRKRVALKAAGAKDGISTASHQTEKSDFTLHDDPSGDLRRFPRQAQDDSQHSDASARPDAPSASGSTGAEAGFGDANLFQVPGAAGKGGGGFNPYEKDSETAQVDFDGVFDIEKVNASDPAVLRQLMKDMGPSIEKAYKSFGEVAEVVAAVREMEAEMAQDVRQQDEPELLQLLQKKSAVHASYMQHLYLYCLLKLEGEWFPTHWVASNLRELRLMLLHIEEEEKALAPEMVETLRRYSAETTAQAEAMDAESGSAEQPQRPNGPAILARLGPEDQEERGGGQDGGLGDGSAGSAQAQHHALTTTGGGAEAGDAAGGLRVSSPRAADARGGTVARVAWSPPVPWRPGEEESWEGQPAEYWQQLFWEAVRLQDEVKAGNLEPSEDQRLFVEQLPFFESMWEAAFHGLEGSDAGQGRDGVGHKKDPRGAGGREKSVGGQRRSGG